MSIIFFVPVISVVVGVFLCIYIIIDKFRPDSYIKINPNMFKSLTQNERLQNRT